MPHRTRHIAALLFSLLAALTLHASAGTLGPLTYTIVDNTTVTITDCHTSASGDIVIPETIEGLPVTKIGDYAFQYDNDITSVTFPSSITSIGNYAFRSSDGYSTFNLPASLTTIGTGAFESCGGLVSITIPSTVTTIPDNLCYACYSLEIVTLHSNITSIGVRAFHSCELLSSISLPANLENLGSLALSGTKIQSITIPTNLSSIGDGAFADCPELIDLQISPSNSHYLLSDGVLFNPDATSIHTCIASKSGTYTIPGGVVHIYDRCFEGCFDLQEIIIPQTVTSIGSFAFHACHSINSLDLPDNLQTLGVRAFSSCSSLESIELPDGLSTLSEGTFYSCSSLTTIDIPASVTSIPPRNTFQFCFKLTEINIDPANPVYRSIDGVVFSADGTTLVSFPPGITGTYSPPTGVTEIGNHAFRHCRLIKQIILPEGVTHIGEAAFLACAALEHITLPDTLTSMSFYPFASCTSLKSILLPPHLTYISSSCFLGCTALESVILPENLKNFSLNSFTGCPIKSIVIPAGVTSLKGAGFSTDLTEIYFLGDAPTSDPEAIPRHEGITYYYLSGKNGYNYYYWYELDLIENLVEIDTSIYPAASWLLENQLSYDDSLEEDDNGDGIPLLMEYALGLKANGNNRSNIPQMEIGQGTAGITFKGNAPGITYEVWQSTDLSDWTQTGVTISDPDTDGLRTATVPLDTAPRAFLQLRVSQ